jgi:hypothetical protein
MRFRLGMSAASDVVDVVVVLTEVHITNSERL